MAQTSSRVRCSTACSAWSLPAVAAGRGRDDRRAFPPPLTRPEARRRERVQHGGPLADRERCRLVLHSGKIQGEFRLGFDVPSMTETGERAGAGVVVASRVYINVDWDWGTEERSDPTPGERQCHSEREARCFAAIAAARALRLTIGVRRGYRALCGARCEPSAAFARAARQRDPRDQARPGGGPAPRTDGVGTREATVHCGQGHRQCHGQRRLALGRRQGLRRRRARAMLRSRALHRDGCCRAIRVRGVAGQRACARRVSRAPPRAHRMARRETGSRRYARNRLAGCRG
jgi:hypothetical protein